MVKNKLITARKEKNLTQNDMAKSLFISQSQYQRREWGEIRISDDEWINLAKLLGKEVEDIKEEEIISTINIYDNCSGTYAAGNNYIYNIPEFIMKSQQEYIELLKREIKWLEDEINNLKKGSC